MPAEILSRRALNRATLARQMLLARESVSALEAVERLAGMQAQEPRPPFVGLWTRVEGFGADELRSDLRERRLVRATLMRTTLHLMSAADYSAFRSALQPVMTWGLRVLGKRADGLEPHKVTAVAHRLLEKKPRTFPELRELLAESFPEVDKRALGYAVRTQLPLVMVPTDDTWGFSRNVRFALADAWLREPLEKADDPRPLVRRYLAAFGPASAADAQTWSGLQKLGPVLDSMRHELATFRDEHGRELFDLPDAPRPADDVPAPARFLPDFDNLLLAHDDRARVIAEEHRRAITTKNLRILATFLWDGFAAGTWRAERKGKNAALELSPFGKLAKRALKELSAEAEALLRFLEPDASAYEVRVAGR